MSLLSALLPYIAFLLPLLLFNSLFLSLTCWWNKDVHSFGLWSLIELVGRASRSNELSIIEAASCNLTATSSSLYSFSVKLMTNYCSSECRCRRYRSDTSGTVRRTVFTVRSLWSTSIVQRHNWRVTSASVSLNCPPINRLFTSTATSRRFYSQQYSSWQLGTAQNILEMWFLTIAVIH